MTFSRADHGPAAGLSVDDGGIGGTWQALDLQPLFTRLADGSASRPAPVRATLAGSTFRARQAAHRPLGASTRPALRPTGLAKLDRIPDEAFIFIGREPSALKPDSTIVRPAPGANDNGGPSVSGTTRVRSVLRDAFFLAVLAATVVGAYYSGRFQAVQKVIVIPISWSPTSVVT